MVTFHACVYVCLHQVSCCCWSLSFCICMCLYSLSLAVFSHIFLCVLACILKALSSPFCPIGVMWYPSFQWKRKSKNFQSQMCSNASLNQQSWSYTVENQMHYVCVLMHSCICIYFWTFFALHLFFFQCTFFSLSLTVREEFATSVENTFPTTRLWCPSVLCYLLYFSLSYGNMQR